MNFLANRLTDCLIANQITSDDYREQYVYGLEVFLEKILNFGTLLILSFVNQDFVPNIFFMITFFSLRGRTGGYHAKHAVTCYIGSIAIYYVMSHLIVPIVLQHKYEGILIGILMVSIVVIFLLAPVNHPNLHLDDFEVIKCRRMSRRLIIAECLGLLIFMWLHISPRCISYAVMGIGTDAGLLLIAKMIGQEVKSNKDY